MLKRVVHPGDPMTRFQEAFEHAVAQIAKDTYVEGSSDAVEERIAKMVPEVAEETAKSMLTTIKRHAPSALKEIRKERREFEERLGKQWQRPLDLLDLFISIATESGDDFNCKFRNDAADSNDAVFKSLTIMHAEHARYPPRFFFYYVPGMQTMHTPGGALFTRSRSSATLSDRMVRIWLKGICTMTPYSDTSWHLVTKNTRSESTTNQCHRKNLTSSRQNVTNS